MAERRGRMRWLISRAGLVRLAVLFLLIGGALAWGWFALLNMPGKSYSGPLPPADEPQRRLAATLRRHIAYLAGRIGQRNVLHRDKLEAAADYVEGELTGSGYRVARQAYDARGVKCFNLEVQIAGGAEADQIVIVGAHYDSVEACPGANDNASGVAAVLALADAFAKAKPARTLRFVAFANEEPPFFKTDLMGSMVYAGRCQERKENVTAMIAFDGLGYYDDAPNTQRYPPPFDKTYPSTANFIAFVGDVASADLVKRAIGVFRGNAKFPSEGGAMFSGIQGVGWSDQWAFWQHGYHGIMVTDTLPFRYGDYHQATDTPDRLDYDRMSRVVAGMKHVVADLAGVPAE
jgi:Peptidase family M28